MSLKRKIFLTAIFLYSIIVILTSIFAVKIYKRKFINSRVTTAKILLETHIDDIIYGSIIKNKKMLEVIENNLKKAKFIDCLQIFVNGSPIYFKKIKNPEEFFIGKVITTSYPLTNKKITILVRLGLNFNDLKLSMIRFSIITGLFGVFSIFIFGIALYLIIISSFKIVENITNAINSIAKGEFKELKVEKTYKEFVSIINSFNIMVKNLNSKIKEINEKNKMLKKQLAEIKALQQIVIMREKLASLGTVVAGIAHEINNPVAAIRGICELNKIKFKDNEQIAIVFDKIISYCDRISNLVKSLKIYGKPTSFKNKQKVSVSEIILDAIEMAKHGKIIDEKIKITGNFKDYHGKIYCIKEEILQVFLNLITNSAEVLKDGGIIEINIFDKNGYIEVHFKDNGPGIPENIRNKIFEPFLTTKEKGTGLGLYICYNILQKHGAEIRLIEDEGAHFQIIFKKSN